MTALQSMPWIAVAVPLAAAVALAAGVRLWGKLAPVPALLGPLAVLATGIASRRSGATGSVEWLRAGSHAVRLTYSVDGLSSIMLMVVGAVALCVMVFSIGYMHGQKGYVRYYAFLSLFTAAMAGLVMAGDLIGLFMSWELVGTCSYLLIGFWYDRPAAAEAARKAFLVTRVGDAAMLLGMGVLWWQTPGSLVLTDVFARLPQMPGVIVTGAAVCLLLGAVGKSAQFPLHAWLPDAMEGPTPVSALIHAATMVAAGVFLVARTWPLFEVSATARSVALVLGTVTALGAATIAVTQSDIKKVLAYSTISQLGFMFAALGAGAWSVAIFHLVTHAAFKALLFLASGSVIHGAETQELSAMGGLVRRMPLTAFTWIVGVLALAGFPGLAGFFSKDEIIVNVWHAAPWAGVALILTSALTGAYAARATRLAFFGDYRGQGTPHESGATMTLPLVALAVGALTLGYAGHEIASMLGEPAEGIAWTYAIVTLVSAAVGGVAGWLPWAGNPGVESTFNAPLERAWRTARVGYGWDGFIERAVLRPVMTIAAFAYAFADRLVIDGIAEGSARGASRLGSWLAELQNGDGQWYAALVAAGTVAVVAFAFWLRAVG